MGSCISKCRPRPPAHKNKEESLLVQDKLVISQAPTIPDIPLPNKQSNFLLSSPSPSSDSCTSYITSSSTCSTSTLSSLSSTCSSSAALVSKDRSFSNEFLWARLKENPQIILHGLDPVKEIQSPVKAVPPKFPTRKLDSSPKSAVQASQAGRIGLPPQKRGRETRDSSPTTLARQRSFRRNLDSPSPSRRGIPINSPKRCNSVKRSCDGDAGLKNNNIAVKSISSSARKENLQLRSQPRKVDRDDGLELMRKRETCTHHIQDGIHQNSVRAMVYNKDSNSLPTDDINNPLISLDCFIFL